MNRIIIFCGPPCSGKTTKSKALSSKSKITRLSVDETCERLYGNKILSELERDIAYKGIHESAEKIIQSNQDVILDGTYARDKQRDAISLVALANNAVLEINECYVSPDDAVKRFLERENHSAKDLTEERVKFLAETYPYNWSLR